MIYYIVITALFFSFFGFVAGRIYQEWHMIPSPYIGQEFTWVYHHSPNIKHRAIMHKWDEADCMVAKRLDGTESEVVLHPCRIHITKVGS